MATRKRTNRAESVAPIEVSSVEPEDRAPKGTEPFVFISHDSRDADLAAAFDNLLTDASGGVIQTFRSSDQSGRAGIEYGENWYSRIAQSLASASDVVALLTPNSTDRPWILFEAGWAVGRLSTKVFGIAMGLPLSKAVTGPFAQFQNCEANEESLTGVVLQLIRRNPSARPREQAVRLQVNAFLKDIEPLLTTRRSAASENGAGAPADVAKLFEEVKVMFRDLAERVSQPTARRRRSRAHPAMFEEIFHIVMNADNPSLGWLLLASAVRDEVPWLAEPVMDMYRATRGRSRMGVQNAARQLQEVLRMSRHTRMMYGMLDDEDSYYYARQVGDLVEHFVALQLEAAAETDAATEAKNALVRAEHHNRRARGERNAKRGEKGASH